MEGRIQNFCDATIKAVTTAWKNLMMMPISEALVSRKGYGKKDTLGMDAAPEILISEVISNYNKEAILVTEETDQYTRNHWPVDFNSGHQFPTFFSDPVDRSKFLAKLLNEAKGRKNSFKKVGNYLNNQNVIKRWEEIADGPAVITGATTSLTCIFRNKIVCSAIINFVTQTLFFASPAGVHQLELPSFTAYKKIRSIDLAYVILNGKKLEIMKSSETSRGREDSLRFISYLGSDKKKGYEENFRDSMIFLENPRKYLHHQEPGGPSRILFLTELQRGHGRIGFILGNGEKIAEWMPWLAFVKYARDDKNEPALKAFEISIKEKPRQKEGILMSTSPAYSIFEMGVEGVEPFLDIGLLRKFKNKSHFRAMIVITPNDNETIIHKMAQNGYREISQAL